MRASRENANTQRKKSHRRPKLTSIDGRGRLLNGCASAFACSLTIIAFCFFTFDSFSLSHTLSFRLLDALVFYMYSTPLEGDLVWKMFHCNLIESVRAKIIYIQATTDT